MGQRRALSLLSAVVVGLIASIASAQVPAGGEFQVNTYPMALPMPLGAAVASDASGNFVVTWTSAVQDGSGFGIAARRFDASGAPRGPEFVVNTYTTGNQFLSSAASDAAGNLVLPWTSALQGWVLGQRYDAGGAPRGGEFMVNTSTAAWPPSFVSSDAAGNFVVVWTGDDGLGAGVVARRYEASGSPRGAEFRVNTYTTGQQTPLDVAVDATGNFVVLWGSGTFLFDQKLFGQRFDASGTSRGTEFRVNTSHLADPQVSASVATDAAGNFVVVWHTHTDTWAGGVFGQRFDAAGARLGLEFQVAAETSDFALMPRVEVASDAAGNFVVVWHGYGDGSGGAAMARRYDAPGAALGPEFRVNTYTTDDQVYPTVASDEVGNFVVVWKSYDFGTPDPNARVLAQRFGGLHPHALIVDPSGTPGSDANHVLEPGETTVEVRPSWRNVNGAAQTFDAGVLRFTGPAATGVTYMLPDETGAYGTVADGAVGQCTNCYQVGVGFAGTRPALHWDATMTERITPDAHGQTKMWAMHVGESFTDVPRTNGFYRFVEVLLHNGVTGGCGTNTYCPASGVTREQMAPFVLVAKEGTGYAPAACTTPMFDDVPASSPFCRWIEELARRGVVTGCGGSNYCPSASVTREQMPVFVLRTLEPALDPPACTTPMFADVPATSPFCRWIEELARRGVVTGCGGGNYCPTAPVTRDQMGVFISVTFGLTLYGP